MSNQSQDIIFYDFQEGEEADPDVILDLEREPGFDPADAFAALAELEEAKLERQRERDRQQEISPATEETQEPSNDRNEESTRTERQPAPPEHPGGA